MSEKCPKCRSDINVTAKYCPSCGADLAAAKATHANSQQSVAPKYCARCGEPNAIDAVFCKRCGQRIADEPSTTVPSTRTPYAQSKTVAVPASKENMDTIMGILDLVAIALCFSPWVGLNLYIWTNDYSVLGLLQAVQQLSGYAMTIMGSAYANSDAASIITGVSILIFVIWLAVVAYLAWDAFTKLISKKSKGSSAAMSLMGFFALAVILVLFVVDFALSDAVGVGTSMGVAYGTGWAWLSALFGIIASFVYAYKTNKKG